MNPEREPLETHIKEALKEIYDLPHMDGIVVCGGHSKAGLSIRGKMAGKIETKLQIAAHLLNQIAGECRKIGWTFQETADVIYAKALEARAREISSSSS